MIELENVSQVFGDVNECINVLSLVGNHIIYVLVNRFLADRVVHIDNFGLANTVQALVGLLEIIRSKFGLLILLACSVPILRSIRTFVNFQRLRSAI